MQTGVTNFDVQMMNPTMLFPPSLAWLS